MTDHFTTPHPQPDPNEPGSTILREALHAQANRVTPTPDWADVRSRADGDGSAVVLAVAAAVIVAVAVITLPRLLDREVDPVLVTPVTPEVETSEILTEGALLPDPLAPTPEPQPTATPVPADPATGETADRLDLPAGEPLPDTQILAVLQASGADGAEHDLVVLDGTGEPIRTLMEGIHTAEGGIYQLSMSADGRTAIYALGTSACTQAIEAIDIDGERSVVVTDNGGTPALSPDGQWLAFDPGDHCVGGSLIELRPLAGGEILRFGTEAAPLAGLAWEDTGAEVVVGEPAGPLVQSMAFLDAQTLLYTVTGGDKDGQLWAFDLKAGQGRRIDPAAGAGRYAGLHHARMGEVVVIHEGARGWEVLRITSDEVLEAHATLGGEPAYQASISDALGVVHTRGSGVAGLVIEGQQVRTDVGAALAGPSVRPAAGATPAASISPVLTPEQQGLARARADAFVAALASGDMAAAAEQWSGYPNVDGSQPGAVEAELRRGVERSDWPFLSGIAADEVIVTPAWTFTEPREAVVTYVFGTGTGAATSLAFLVALASDPGATAPMIRLPGWAAGTDRNSLDGAEFSEGATVLVPGLPIEGGALAHVNGLAVPVEVDHDGQVLRVTLPEGLTGDVTLTLSVATPEAPSAESHALTVMP